MQPLWGEDKPWMEVTYYIHQQLMWNLPIYYQSPSEMKAYINQQKAP